MERIALERMRERRSPSATHSLGSADVINRGCYGEVLVYIERGFRWLKKVLVGWWNRKKKKKRNEKNKCKMICDKHSKTVCSLRALSFGCCAGDDEECCFGVCRRKVAKQSGYDKSGSMSKRRSLKGNLREVVNVVAAGDQAVHKHEIEDQREPCKNYQHADKKSSSDERSSREKPGDDESSKSLNVKKVTKMRNGRVKRNVNFELNEDAPGDDEDDEDDGDGNKDSDDDGDSDGDDDGDKMCDTKCDNKVAKAIYKCCDSIHGELICRMKLCLVAFCSEELSKQRTYFEISQTSETFKPFLKHQYSKLKTKFLVAIFIE